MVELLVGCQVMRQFCEISRLHRAVGAHGGQVQRIGRAFRADYSAICRISRVFGNGDGICRASFAVNAEIDNPVGEHDRYIRTAHIGCDIGSRGLAVGYRLDTAVTADAESVCASAVARFGKPDIKRGM